MSETTNEGSIWFWKIFGGAIIGLVSLLTITLINTINNTNQQSKSDMLVSIQDIKSEIKCITGDLGLQKEKLSKIESNKLGEEISTIRKKLEDIEKTVNDRNEKIAVIEGSILVLKDQVNKDSTSNKEIYQKIMELENQLNLIKAQSKMLQTETEIKKTSLRD